ncbi:Hsp20/alpha crystallin family protein [Mycobacterium palustre]|nr:Hsp20/alpha crystallin family protein [Mycobacterium palustre]
MLMFDPFLRDFDRLTQQLLGTTTGTPARPVVMPMDAWRDGDQFVVELDLPGLDPDCLDIHVEHDVLTVRAERPAVAQDGRQWLACERPHGVFSRQILLGTSLDTGNITADYTDGVLRLTIPVAEHAKPRKIAIANGKQQQAINA